MDRSLCAAAAVPALNGTASISGRYSTFFRQTEVMCPVLYHTITMSITNFKLDRLQNWLGALCQVAIDTVMF